ncbi:MAG: alpha/beta fold hydrolase [Prevotellaceae bacterium]|jgi:pimeloyl-ACP methyl ester carboxylesterase|nr:alpha/beta fold hydrolase [Prevotellaceae bacterium]
MQLFFRKFGNTGNNIIILHGLYGCSDNWTSIAKSLSRENQVFVADLRNHGRSPHSDEHSYEAMCGDLAEFIQHNGIEKPVIIGYSMGGRCAALLARQYPDLLSKVVIVDISPFDCENQEAISAFHKNILSALMRINTNEISSRHEAAAKLSETVADIQLQNFLLKNLYRTSKGGFLWRFNLPALLNNVNNIMCGSLEKSEKHTVQTPALFVVGTKSNHVVSSDIKIITNVFSDLEIASIHEAGHRLHVEQQEKFVAFIQKFING